MSRFEHEIASSFRKAICNLSDRSYADQSVSPDVLEKFKEAFKVMGSYTPDNVSCIDLIDYVLFTKGSDSLQWSLSIKCGEENVSIPDILWVLEELPPPSIILEKFPSLDQEIWSKMMRFILMLVHGYSVDKEDAGHSQNLSDAEYS